MEFIWNHTAIMEARKGAGMAQKVAADFLKITPEYLSMIENGKSCPSQKLIASMAALYHCQPVRFLREEKTSIPA